MTIAFYHMCALSEWVAAQRQGEYRAVSLTTEGFIHASTQEQIVATANRYYRGRQDLVLLGIDRQKLTAEVRWEAATHGGLYPHIYGLIPLDAVAQVIPFPCNNEGHFTLPELPKARLSTPRLIVREFVPEDWHSTFAYSSDLDVMRFVTYRADTPEEAQAFVQDAIAKAQKQPREEYQWAVTLPARHNAIPPPYQGGGQGEALRSQVDKTQNEGTLIGGCGLWLTEAHQEAEIGYCFARPYWGQGYATETVRALLGFGFETLGLHRILARCNAENAASAHVMRKCGMQREAHLREKIWGLGRWWDEEEYAILAQEWSPLH